MVYTIYAVKFKVRPVERCPKGECHRKILFQQASAARTQTLYVLLFHNIVCTRSGFLFASSSSSSSIVSVVSGFCSASMQSMQTYICIHISTTWTLDYTLKGKFIYMYTIYTICMHLSFYFHFGIVCTDAYRRFLRRTRTRCVCCLSLSLCLSILLSHTLSYSPSLVPQLSSSRWSDRRCTRSMRRVQRGRDMQRKKKKNNNTSLRVGLSSK